MRNDETERWLIATSVNVCLYQARYTIVHGHETFLGVFRL